MIGAVLIVLPTLFAIRYGYKRLVAHLRSSLDGKER